MIRHILNRISLPMWALALAVLSGVVSWQAVAAAQEAARNRVLLIVVDGLRPDYITPEITPHLHALGERGVVADAHSSMYPTYTRPNSATVGTGAYPGTHGLIHNNMYHPAMGEEPFSAGSASNLRRFNEATGGNLLTAVPLADALAAQGLSLLATGTGGTGTTLLQNPAGAGKGIWLSRGLFMPESARETAIEALGPLPEDPGSPEGTAWAVRSYLHHALGSEPPDVTLMWINAPDSAAHSNGVGAPATLATVADVDRNIGRILEAHAAHGLTERVNIFISSDHGFSTTVGGLNVERILENAGIALDGVRIVRNMVWVEEGGPERLRDITEALQRHEAAGNIYTRPAQPGASEGMVPGTLSTEAVLWNHPRSADLIASPAWTSDINEFGYAGTTTFGGTATHGSDSPYDLRIRLLAAGPDIKEGVRSAVPTSNADFAPTFLHLFGIEPPETVDGRVMRELLVNGPDPGAAPVQRRRHRAAITYQDGFSYEAVMDTLELDGAQYLRGAMTRRSGGGR